MVQTTRDIGKLSSKILNKYREPIVNRVLGKQTSGQLRQETWRAGNCYVGKYSDLSMLDDDYMSIL